MLLLKLSATDTDWPPQHITFALAAGAPAGATINPDTGLFSWRPTPDQAPSTNHITVLATDDGQPPMTGSGTFVARVFSRPQFSSVSQLPNGDLSLIFGTIPGKTYRVEGKDDLNDASWTPFDADAVATGYSLTVIARVANSSQRFYRILLVDQGSVQK